MSNTLEHIAAQPNLIRIQWLEPDDAIQEVLAFQQRFSSKHLWLACHAAFPLILTPELVNLIHFNFLEDRQIPYIAQADFLLSPLCREIEDGVFEVEPGVREVLLVMLEKLFDHDRPFELAYFLDDFLKRCPDRNQRSMFRQTHEWIAGAYIQPDEVLEEMQAFLERRIFSETIPLRSLSSQIQLATLAEITAEPLERANSHANYRQLRHHARIIGYALHGDRDELQQNLIRDIREEKLPDYGSGQISPEVVTWLKNELEIIEERDEKPQIQILRQKEAFERITHLLSPDTDVRLINIHTNGECGLGSTYLLHQIQENCTANSDELVFSPNIIDFYDIESRSRLGVIQQIVKNLDSNNFPEFRQLLELYQKTQNFSERAELFQQVERNFHKEYAALAVKLRIEKKVIVLFFDSYQHIQGTETSDENVRYAEPTFFSQWIEIELFPYIAENTRLIVSGRYPLRQIERETIGVEEFQLTHFSFQDSLEFWKHFFHVETDDELFMKIGTRSTLEIIHTLADGHPILLGLFADWVNYERNPLSPEDLIKDIERSTQQPILPPTSEQKILFEKALIHRIASLFSPEDRVVIYMTIVHRRMTPEMLQFLIKRLPLNECQEIMNRMESLPFIKVKRGGVIVLHNELRLLVIEYWWEQQDSGKTMRREIAKLIIQYYEEKLLADSNISEIAREIYTCELVEYAFLADPQNGLQRFSREFDIALQDGKFDYCDQLLREAEEFQREYPKSLSFPEVFHIRLRRIRYYLLTNRDYMTALNMAQESLEEYRDNTEWLRSELHGHFLYVYGFAASWLKQFEEALKVVQQAKAIFFDIGEDYWLYRTEILIGYIYYRQGHFALAEKALEKSRQGFYRFLIYERESEEWRYRQLLQGVQICFGHLAMVYCYTGRFDQAVRHAEMLLSLASLLPRNRREIAKALNTLSQVLTFTGDQDNARYYAEKTRLLLEQGQIHDRILTGCIKINVSRILYHAHEFSTILGFYRAEELEALIHHSQFVEQEGFHTALQHIQDTLRILDTEPILEKELSEAYSILGEIFTISRHVGDSWIEAEIALSKSRELARKSQFQYGVVHALCGLLSLYYLGNGTKNIHRRQDKEHQKKMAQFRKELDSYEKSLYLDLFGKYLFILGNIEFDKALHVLDGEGEKSLNTFLNRIKKAFTHYISAIALLKQFNEKFYYSGLHALYHHLSTLTEFVRKQNRLSGVFILNELQALWKGKNKELDSLHYYVSPRALPSNTPVTEEYLNELQRHIQRASEQGNIRWALILNNCLTDTYHFLLSSTPENEIFQEQLILQLNIQAIFYHSVGNELQAMQCIRSVKEKIPALQDQHIQSALEGCVDSTEGSFIYQKGYYGGLFDFSLKEPLETIRLQTHKHITGNKDHSNNLLLLGLNKLNHAISFWQNRLSSTDDSEEQAYITNRIQRYAGFLSETHYYLAESAIMDNRFENTKSGNLNFLGAFYFLRNSIEEARRSKDDFRYNCAVLNYLKAMYLSGKYEHSDYIKEYRMYEKQIEENVSISKKPFFPLIMGRLRILQANILFSQYFQYEESPYRGFRYIVSETKTNPGTVRMALRMILKNYVEACNFMAQHSSTNFEAAVRVLIQRIDFITDKTVLELIQSDLRTIWNHQDFLREKNEELQILEYFVNIKEAHLWIGNDRP